jgi:hypothetical protein
MEPQHLQLDVLYNIVMNLETIQQLEELYMTSFC